jgi:hypothetical protein
MSPSVAIGTQPERALDKPDRPPDLIPHPSSRPIYRFRPLDPPAGDG